MAKKRFMNDEIISRIEKVDKVIFDWMRSNNINEIDPERSILILVEKGIYNFDSKGSAHHFREDLRTLRDCKMLGIFSNLVVEQTLPRARWVIKRLQFGI